jgi:adenosine deaminase/adenosine deaminase CECR1
MYKRRFYLNTTTMEVLKENPVTTGSSLLQLEENSIHTNRNNGKWSVKDYNGVSYPSDKLLNRLRNLVHFGHFEKVY